MSFYIPAEDASKVGALPPGTGRYEVIIDDVVAEDKTDRNGCWRYRVDVRFENGGRGRAWFGSPCDEDGNFSRQLLAMDEQTRSSKVNGYIAAIKDICYSAGLSDEYMNEHGISSDHLPGRTAYIEWLGRPEDTPKGTKAYGDIGTWLTKDVFDRREERGDEVKDNRTFAWRANSGSGGSDATSSENKRELPPPPGKKGGKLPPPPGR